MTIFAMNSNLRNRLIISIGALLILVGVAGYFLVKESQHDIIEQQALTVAEIVVRHATSVRSVYSESIVKKLKADGTGKADFSSHETEGNVPLPAQFIKSVSGKASADAAGLYRYRAVSKWNLAPDQGLETKFLKTAWEALEAQDQANPDNPIDWSSKHIIQKKNGAATLLYLKADPAVSQACIDCHNNYEQRSDIIARRIKQNTTPKKQWKKNQLMGAFFVEIPLSGIQSIAVKESTESVVWIVIVLTGGLIVLAYFLVGDVSKANEKTEKLYWQARHDPLTGLPNRTHFEEKAAELIQQAKVSKSTHFMCFLDLDRFKVVNDSCGHTAGDELLCRVASELKHNLLQSQILARLGGDEFGVLLANCSEHRAIKVSEQLCRKIKDYHFVCNDQVFDIGVSIGLVEINSNTGSVEQALSLSDIACYAAKEAGRNRVQVYKENDAEIAYRSEEMSWVPRILNALEEKKLIIYSQEIGSVARESSHSHFEVLVRLVDRNGSIISPDEFLPAAERYNLMDKIDTYVIEQAFGALKRNLFKGLGDTDFISINLTGQSLSDEDFLGHVTELLDQYEINPRQVCFEITETSAIKNPKLVRRFMDSLKSRGVRFALDDFGTGLSSLTYLKQFPVDYLKIDGSFVKDMMTNSVDRKLVSAINQLAHTMNIKTIAEYVETKEILALLDEMDVDYAQGYYINKPQAVEPA